MSGAVSKAVPRRIMIVGSGPWQLHLIRKAKARGLFVVNTNLYEDSEGFPYADVGVAVDIYDREGQLTVARKYEVDAVTTDQIDIAVPTVAWVAEQMGVPGIGADRGELFTNKFRMREFAKAHGFTQPKYRLCRTLEEAKVAVSELGGYSVIVKPTNNRSSRGVHKVSNDAELAEKLEDTRSNSREPSFLVEEFIGGKEFSVEGFMTPGKHTALAVSRKDQFEHNAVLDSRVFYPKDDRTYDYSALKQIQNALIEVTGLPFGITHAEYKFWNDRFYMIEFAARGGGANISSHIIPIISGVDVNDLLLSCALGESIPPIEPKAQTEAAVLEFFFLQPGKVKSIRGLEEIRASPGVADVGLNFKVGDTLVLPPHGGARAGHFIAHAPSDAELDALCARIHRTLKVEYE